MIAARLAKIAIASSIAAAFAACGGPPKPSPTQVTPRPSADAASHADAGAEAEKKVDPPASSGPCVHLARRKPAVPIAELAIVSIKRQKDSCSIETRGLKGSTGQMPPPEDCGTDALSKVLTTACAIGGEYVYGAGSPATEFHVGKYTQLDEGADVRAICEAPKKKPIAKADLTPKARAHYYAQQVEDDITTPVWRGFLRSASAKGLKTAASELREATKTFKIAKCPVADEWDALQESAESP